ncbi:MAG: EAL domain-containing protein [gamma proteobacterium symbiont of Bathyaustriella thionipta]|nr:EAL domain-containing protein [gamma proteobacterium symbiont of Bathyaustriella thionipta]
MKLISHFIVVTACLLIALAGSIYWYNSVRYNELDDQVVAQLRQLQTINNHIIQTVIMAASGRLQHYDDLVSDTQQHNQVMQQLQSELSSLQGRNPQFEQLLQAYSRHSEERFKSVENFKSYNATLLNSIAFLPYLIDNLNISLESEANGQVLAASLQAVLLQVMLYAQTNSERWRLAVYNELSEVEELADMHPDAQASIQLVLQHTRTILEEKPRVSDLINKISSPIVGNNLQKLLQEYQSIQRIHQARDMQWRSMLLLLTIITLLIIAYVLQHLIRNSKQLRLMATYPEYNPYPVFSLHSNGNIVFRNPATTELQIEYGMSDQELLGTLPGDPAEIIKNAVRGGMGINNVVTHFVDRHWLVNIQPIPSLPGINCYLSEISEQYQQELFTQHQKDFLSKVATDVPLAESLTDLCRILDQQITHGMTSILRLLADGETLGSGVSARLPDAYISAFEGLAVSEAMGSCGTAAHRRETVFVPDIATDPLWAAFRDFALSHGVHACWSTPIIGAKGALLGTCALSFGTSARPDEKQVELLKQAASLAAIAIEHDQTVQDLRQSEASIRELYQVAIGPGNSVKQRAEELLRMGCQRFAMSSGLMIEMDAQHRHIISSAASNEVAATLTCKDIGDDIIQDIFISDQPIAHLQQDKSTRHLSPTYIGCRIDINHKPFGIIIFVSFEPYRRRFSDSDVELLRLMAHWISNELEREQAYHRLDTEKERAQVTLASIGDGVITTDRDGCVQYMNPVAEALCDWQNASAIGLPLYEVFNIINESSHEKIDNPVEQCMLSGQVVHLTHQNLLVDKSGNKTAIEDSAAPIRDRNGEIIGAVLVFHDVSAQRELKQQLSYQASHDVLTELHNRTAFEARLSELLQNSKDSQQTHALLYMDLDQFKIVNDTSGHIAGDELLREISKLLSSQIRSSDMLARLGGDEFGVLLSNCPLTQAHDIAEKLREAVQLFRFRWENNLFDIGVSIGLIEITSNNNDSNELMSAADIACYTAKDAGRNRIHHYVMQDSELHQRKGEMRWVARLRQAVDQGEFALCCQRIIALQSNETHPYCEVLLRMQAEDNSLLLPDKFIPAAERYDLMPDIDYWVIEHALKRLQHSGQPDQHIAINLSGRTINADKALPFIHKKLNEYAIESSRVCFEITETAAVSSLAQTRIFMESLRARGCHFALDDFGSGLSSYAYLKSLPVDYLKIDGMFVHDLLHDRVARSIVESTNQVAHVMGIKTVAEWVENEETRLALKEIGIDYAQGFHMGLPEPYNEHSHLTV